MKKQVEKLCRYSRLSLYWVLELFAGSQREKNQLSCMLHLCNQLSLLFFKKKKVWSLSPFILYKKGEQAFCSTFLSRGAMKNLVLHRMTFALSGDSQSFHLLPRFRLLKECNRLCEFWFILCIFMDINAFLIRFTSLNESFSSCLRSFWMSMTSRSHGRDEVYISHKVNKRLQKRRIEPSRNNRTTSLYCSPAIISQNFFIIFISLHEFNEIFIRLRNRSPRLLKDMTRFFHISDSFCSSNIFGFISCHFPYSCGSSMDSRGSSESCELWKH